MGIEVSAAVDVPIAGIDDEVVTTTAVEEASARPEETTWAMEEAMLEASAAGIGMPKGVPQAISCIIVVVAISVTVTCLLSRQKVSRLVPFQTHSFPRI